jgi:hypothetical protein
MRQQRRCTQQQERYTLSNTILTAAVAAESEEHDW